MQEIWKDIPNTDGLYSASTTGQIKSNPRIRYYKARGKEGYYLRNGKILKPVINSHGYPCVAIKYANGSQKTITVHRLIALTFLENNNPQANQVNHIDGDKTNNSINNLEWCTASENLYHAFKMGLNKGSKPMLGRKGKDSPRSKPIYKCDKLGNIIDKYDSVTEAANELNISPAHISSCANGHRKTCAGFVWKYIN